MDRTRCLAAEARLHELPGLLRGGLGGQGSMKPFRGAPGASAYRPIDLVHKVMEVLTHLRRHSLLMWVILPAFAVAQKAFAVLRPTCTAGYSDYSGIAVAALIGHHLLAEAGAWSSAKELLTAPELTVLRSLGVLRQRRGLVLLGLLEDINLYSDFSFPLLAYECEGSITELWAASWAGVPALGPHAAVLARRLGFSGAAACCAAAAWLAGLAALWELLWPDLSGMEDQHEVEPRLSGSAFVSLASLAEAAGTPSVGRLCQEMGLQRRWVYDAKEELGGAAGAARAREGVVFGRLRRDALKTHELMDEEEGRRVDAAGSEHVYAVFVRKVLVGNLLQLWLQVTFLGLASDGLGAEARTKLVFRIVLSSLYVVARCAITPFNFDCLGCTWVVLSCLITAWACAKAYFAVACPGQTWDLTSGCVSPVAA